ncbi:EEF1A lysine methyltransferase 2 isoform X3 [Elephas maximus indicus]|uniref:EEF1A lysine methyltransferase 2 isoform X3 n=1 Tax=Elephas maximus indicus TaxID=99487 RepID=UPI002115D355|nr:EEF1A lysine methyltransferase 2 isoform X3 [Elephas maximus indicus]
MSVGSDGGGGAAAAARSREGSPGKDGFAPSALGTREHWDAVYQRELQTFQEYGDAGEIWFGEESMNRLIRWMEKQKIPLDASILDIGTGNGVFLVELLKTMEICVYKRKMTFCNSSRTCILDRRCQHSLKCPPDTSSSLFVSISLQPVVQSLPCLMSCLQEWFLCWANRRQSLVFLILLESITLLLQYNSLEVL